MNSATSALLSALVALGIGPGDEVIVPGYTFIASIAAVIHAGATPVLAEIDDSLTMDPADVLTKLTGRTRAVLPVHMLGRPCDMAAISSIATDRRLLVIEDVAQACGGSFNGRRLGTWGDAGAFSLNGAKVITAGDGGVLVTPHAEVYQRAFAFHDHGSAPLRLGVGENGRQLGVNLRMHELTGAMALVQLRRLDFILDRLREKQKVMVQLLGELPGVSLVPARDPDGECCTVLTLTADSADRAEAIAATLGTSTLDKSPRHNYWRMPQLRDDGSAPQGKSKVLPGTKKGMLPRTDDLLARSLGISIGVVDPYLGTGYGITIESDQADIVRVSGEIRKAVMEAW